VDNLWLNDVKKTEARNQESRIKTASQL